MEKSLEILYPRLRLENKNIIEKAFYLNSKKNNFIQIADICSFYVNKYNCLISTNYPMNSLKKEHCIKMYEKLSSAFFEKSKILQISLFDFDSYFK